MRGLVTLVCLLFSSLVFAGPFSLERSGERYTLTARDALLSDILAEIDRQEPASLKFYGDYQRLVSATYRDVPLEKLLERLGVSYVLTYEAGDDGTYRLGDAKMLDSDAPAAPPESAGTAESIRALVRDLADDDIKWNAHEAYGKLQELGCAAVPFLEETLRSEDSQARHIAANLLREICPEHPPSQDLLTVTLELLNGQRDEFAGELVYPSWAYDFLNRSNIYPFARQRILDQLTDPDPRIRLYSSLIAANQRETAFASRLVRTLLPHLADNDLKGDAAASAYALRQLGNAALPYLHAARASTTDQQQKELLGLIVSAINQDAQYRFNPVMYVGYNKTPTETMQWIDPTRWSPDAFPDSSGRYSHGGENRMNAADYYRY